MKLNVDVKHKQYDIILESGCSQHLSDYTNVEQKSLIITDTNIPDSLIKSITDQLTECRIYKVPAGEQAKSMEVFKKVLEICLDYHMSRSDRIIALGGGVVGDLSGYVAASYMRGISYISIPTTTLSQIDSSIGGKVAINLDGVKNIVGAFYHPDLVLVDFDTLKTLPHRQVINGLIEAIKAGLIHDPKIFELFEDGYEKHLEEIIYRSLMMKKKIVEQDETEHGIRKTLNFGHTIGHGIEAYYDLSQYYHGECVAMGMLYFIEDDGLLKKVKALYKKMGIQPKADFDPDKVYDLILMDKKAHASTIDVCYVKELGNSYIKTISIQDIRKILDKEV